MQRKCTPNFIKVEYSAAYCISATYIAYTSQGSQLRNSQLKITSGICRKDILARVRVFYIQVCLLRIKVCFPRHSFTKLQFLPLFRAVKKRLQFSHFQTAVCVCTKLQFREKKTPMKISPNCSVFSTALQTRENGCTNHPIYNSARLLGQNRAERQN